MSWRSWSDEFIERVVAFHVKHCGVGWFAGWLFGSVVSSLLVVGGWCFTWNMEVCLGWFVGIGCCGFEEWNRISLTVEWADLSCLRSVDVSRETIPLTQRILLIYLLCFTWNMGNACEGNLLRLRLCFEACFMGWVWRIRTNECWIGRVLSFSFVFSWFYCVGGLVVFSGVWRLLDVSRETRRFYNNPFVSRETLVLLYDVPRMSMCFTWNAGWGG